MSALRQETSNKLANMGFVCSLLVVVIHVDRPVITHPMLEAAFSALIGAAVPFFFFASGFFVMSHVDSPGWWIDAVKRRCKTLLIPYFSWLVVGLVIYAATDVMVNWLNARELFGGLRGFCGSGRAFFGLRMEFAPGVLPFWYLRYLFLLTILAIVLKLAARRFAFGLLAGLVFLMVVVDCLFAGGIVSTKSDVGRFLVYGMPVYGLFYYFCGIVIAMHRQYANAIARRWPVALFAFIVLDASSQLFVGAYCDAVRRVLMIPCVLIALWRVISGKTRIPVADLSFPIFLIHGIALDPIRALCAYFSVQTGFVSFMVIFAVCVLVSAGVAYAMKSCSANLSRLAFGGRV